MSALRFRWGVCVQYLLSMQLERQPTNLATPKKKRSDAMREVERWCGKGKEAKGNDNKLFTARELASKQALTLGADMSIVRMCPWDTAPGCRTQDTLQYVFHFPSAILVSFFFIYFNFFACISTDAS